MPVRCASPVAPGGFPASGAARRRGATKAGARVDDRGADTTATTPGGGEPSQVTRGCEPFPEPTPPPHGVTSMTAQRGARITFGRGGDRPLRTARGPRDTAARSAVPATEDRACQCQ
ncbi:hypothetical protein GCM10023347_18550 [Streptomyces chumphonensis]